MRLPQSYFSTVFLHHKWVKTRLLLSKGECTSCLKISCQTTKSMPTAFSPLGGLSCPHKKKKKKKENLGIDGKFPASHPKAKIRRDMVKHELRVTSDVLRVEILKAQVERLKARVKIQNCEFRCTSYEFKSTSKEFNSTSYEFKSTSYKFKSTSYEFKSTSYELKSTSHEFKSTSYELKSTSSRIIKSMKTQVKSLKSVSFPKIISPKLFDNSWGNSYVQFLVIISCFMFTLLHGYSFSRKLSE